MLIGELSERTGASTRSLRYFDRKGIISGERRENGYRDVGEGQAGRVRTAQFYMGLGISTDMVARILNCQGNCLLPEAGGSCEEGLLILYREKRGEIDKQIQALTEARERLEGRISLSEEQRRKIRSPSLSNPSKRRRRAWEHRRHIACRLPRRPGRDARGKRSETTGGNHHAIAR